ncbi:MULTISPECIES: hypothetical protein [Mycolicibacter]|uniref:Uncharacterized protein n=2 Tax=Mycolicibacter TaxID=1073531 RepID=A0ABU5XM67_9MYCO|nr:MULTISPECIES: hypothetical protein [unclassified Mycolicibacter]MEB3023370.1 hypothetical protein [Mycolicibacter sp. MYC098]MEB3033712.1 hypothetical protein [Mycolicibacter sp. MYC340]
MGTNYYVTGPGIAGLLLAGADGDEPGLHIGKKSAGWEYLFRAHPQLQLTSVRQWREFVAIEGRQIVSEYQAVQDVEEFFAMATQRPAGDPELRAHARTPSSVTSYTYDMAAGGVRFLACEFC